MPGRRPSLAQTALDAVGRAGAVPVHKGASTAADAPPAEVCRTKVEGCDAYVGLLGFRYGTPVRGDEARSYVELEYDAATEACGCQ